MKIFDLPPVWLLLSLIAAWALGLWLPKPALGTWAGPAGVALIAMGILLMGLAVVAMRRARTTVHPHGQPEALVRDGVFQYSRNPIYLGDAMALAGAIFLWDAAVGLIVLPAFMALLRRRFILPEEARLADRFGADYESWAARTRRWI